MLLTLPCAGIIRTGSKGVLSPGRAKSTSRRPGPLALAAKVRRNAAPGNASVDAEKIAFKFPDQTAFPPDFHRVCIAHAVQRALAGRP